MSQVTTTRTTGREVRPPVFGFEEPFLRSNFFGINPIGLVRQFTEDIERAFGPRDQIAGRVAWMPAIEMKEVNGNLLVNAELPGMKKEDVKVTIANDLLCLEGERKEVKEDKSNDTFRSERTYGRFYRAIPLPKGSKAELAAAKFTDGMLEVSIPIPKAAEKSLHVPIEDGTKAKVAPV